MIDTLSSPISRRIIAVALLLLAIISLVNLVVVPVWQACADSLDELAAARSRLARMEAVIAQPAPEPGDKVPASAMIISPTRDGAIATLAGGISASAAKAKISPQSVNPVVQGPPGRVGVDIVAAGSEIDLVAFLGEIEGTSPAIRLQSWSIVAPATADDQAHLQARAVALWGARP